MYPKWLVRWLYIALGIVVVVSVLWLFSNIFLYLVISLVVSSLLRPITDYIHDIYFFQVRVPRIVAVLISFTLLAAVLTFFVILFIPLVSEQVHILTTLDYDLLFRRITGIVAGLERFLINVLRINEEPGFLTANLRKSLFSFFDEIDINSVINFTIQLSTAFFITALAVVFMTFFLLYEKGLLRRAILPLIPNRYFELTITTLHKVEQLLSNYLFGLLMQIFFIFTLTAVGLTVVGINYALTISVFAALANVVPYIGPAVGAAFAILIGISTTSLPDVDNALVLLIVKILLVAFTIKLTDDLVLQPLIFSKSVKAHPLEIFVAIFAGAALAGLVGMVVAIPVYTIIRVSLIEFQLGARRYHVFKK